MNSFFVSFSLITAFTTSLSTSKYTGAPEKKCYRGDLCQQGSWIGEVTNISDISLNCCFTLKDFKCHKLSMFASLYTFWINDKTTHFSKFLLLDGTVSHRHQTLTNS